MAVGARVKLWHPHYQAEANPLKQHVEAWLAKGWVKVDVQTPKGEKK